MNGSGTEGPTAMELEAKPGASVSAAPLHPPPAAAVTPASPPIHIHDIVAAAAANMRMRNSPTASPVAEEPAAAIDMDLSTDGGGTAELAATPNPPAAASPMAAARQSGGLDAFFESPEQPGELVSQHGHSLVSALPPCPFA